LFKFKVGPWVSQKPSKSTLLPSQLSDISPIKEESAQPEVKAIDYDKLYNAVAVAESGNCSTSWHKAAKNCVSIMSWSGGKRHLKQFSSIDDSKTAFKQLWILKYGDHLPTLQDAIKYTGNDKAYGWLQTVNKWYHSH